MINKTFDALINNNSVIILLFMNPNPIINIKDKSILEVGPGTGRDADFDDAITMETVEGSYVLSYETDGSYDPKTAFNLAMNELASRFDNITSDLDKAFA